MEEVQEPEVAEKIGSKLASAVAVVQGDVQESGDDACSICLEDFCESDPPAITGCKHEFHLHCILEWCQRSSQCPMCWQRVYLLDPASQELFEGVERERNFRSTLSRGDALFQHSTIHHFDLHHHFPVSERDAELEEHVIQRFVAAAMGGRHHIFQGESQMSRSFLQGHRQFSVFLSPVAPHGTGFSPAAYHGDENEPASYAVASTSVPHLNSGEARGRLISSFPVQADHSSMLSDRPSVTWANRVLPEIRISAGQPSLGSSDGAGPSNFQTFSESLKSQLFSMSMRYRESISRSARGWAERWFSRSSSMDGFGSLVEREVNAGVASFSRVFERFENRDSNGSRLVSRNGDVSSDLGHRDHINSDSRS